MHAAVMVGVAMGNQCGVYIFYAGTKLGEALLQGRPGFLTRQAGVDQSKPVGIF